MLYICIPAYNEAPTIGVLLWRIRKMFQEFSREYEIVVYDDGSTDATAETLAPYREVLPLTVLGGAEHKGYAAALDALARTVAKRTRYPRRDAAIFLQADFTDQPEHIPELVKRFEGGADVVVAERPAGASGEPLPVRRLRRAASWVVRPFVSVPGVRDPFGAFRLYRISVLRDLIRAVGGRPVVAAEGWGANVELLMNAAAFSRRVEGVELAARYGVRTRETRVRALADAMALFRFARTARARRLSAPPPGTRESAAAERAGGGGGGGRPPAATDDATAKRPGGSRSGRRRRKSKPPAAAGLKEEAPQTGAPPGGAAQQQPGPAPAPTAAAQAASPSA
ncbi:MAG: glycosyltransferase family 2 protein [Gemmatimonadaceae bacterium]